MLGLLFACNIVKYRTEGAKRGVGVARPMGVLLARAAAKTELILGVPFTQNLPFVHTFSNILQ